MAATLQHAGPYRLGREDLLVRARCFQSIAAANLPWGLGYRTVPSSPPSGSQYRSNAIDDAGIVPRATPASVACHWRSFMDTVVIRLAIIGFGGHCARYRGRDKRCARADDAQV